MNLGLEGKAAIVTGGTRGIGLEIAERLAQEGCRVAICGRSAERLGDALRVLGRYPVATHGCIADVTDAEQVETFVRESVDVFGRLDYLIANAGGGAAAPILGARPEDWTRMFALNVFHVGYAVAAAVPHMRLSAGTSILVVASVSGMRPGGPPAYGAAKAGAILLAEALAQELAADGIRVNALSPGAILAPGGGWAKFKETDPEAFAQFERRAFPAQRLGTPAEIADVAVFLLSPRATWINGTNVRVDGAQRMSLETALQRSDKT